MNKKLDLIRQINWKLNELIALEDKKLIREYLTEAGVPIYRLLMYYQAKEESNDN